MNKRILTQNDFSDTAIARNETLFTLANGNLGLRGDFEERDACFHKGTYINGFYDTEPIQYGEVGYGYAENHQTILNLPDPKLIETKINGEKLSLLSGRIKNFQHSLDFEKGLLSREFIWEEKSESAVKLTTRRLVSFSEDSVAAIEYKLTALEKNLSVELISGIDTGVRNISSEEDPRVGSKFSSKPLIIDSLRADSKCLGFTAHTRHSNLSLAGSVRHSYSFENSNADTIQKNMKREFLVEDDLVLEKCSFVLEEGETFRLIKYISYEHMKNEERDSLGGIEKVVEKTQATLDKLEAKGFESLVLSQSMYLKAFWDIAAIEIEGDTECEQALYCNLFHLLQSSGKDGKTSIAAKGLTAEGYEGHFFWDTEAYICPVFTYLKPDLAQKLLEYRYAILPQAKKRSQTMALKGALYPWRTINGEETSAYYPAGTAQYHINADIMYALKKYMQSGNNPQFNTNQALEMGIETARMWMSLGSFIESKDNQFCINLVTGPDEYTACVNNNAYTNVMAQENLKFSIALVKQYGKSVNGIEEVSEAELCSWQEAVDRMYIPYDANLGIIPQDDSFMDKAEWNFAETPREKYPLLLHYHPLVIYRHRVLKQPYLVLAQFMLSNRFTLAEKKRNFRFYEPLTTGDSSLSHCIHSIVACEVGDYEKAFSYFEKTAQMDIADMHGNTKDGIHTAAMAGSWMSVVYGFAGFRDADAQWCFNPALPKKWSKLSFSLILASSVLDIVITKTSTSYSLRCGNDLELWHRNKAFTLKEGESQSFCLSPDLEAVIFDLDGVITDTADLHYQAWKKISDIYGLAFDREVNERLRGVSREESLAIILSHNKKEMSEAMRKQIAEEKNKLYVASLESLSPKDILPGIKELFDALKQGGIKIALASSSRNARRVCEKLELLTFFDGIADISKLPLSKPAPDIFLEAARLVDAWPQNCVGVEDAQAGIDAIRDAGMFSIGIGDVKNADILLSSTKDLDLSQIQKLFF